VLVVAVLSEPTAELDLTDKFADCRRLETLREHILVDLRRRRVEVIPRSDDGWRFVPASTGDTRGLASRAPVRILAPMPSALQCPTCGGPLDPAASEIRTRCPFCGAAVNLASAGALRVASTLDRLGIRVPDKPMTVDQIEEEIAERERARRMQLRDAAIVAAVLLGVAVVVGLALVAVMR
jgi:hypothetical protein